MPKPRTGAAICAALLSLTASGCWWQVGYDAGHSRHNPLEDTLTAANAASLTEAWSVQLPSPLSEPVVADGRVYVTVGDSVAPTTDVEVRAFDVASGEPEWSTSLVSLPEPVELFAATPVTFDGDRLWTGYTALDLASGSGRWASGVHLDPETGRASTTGSDLGLADPVLDTGEHMVQVTGLLDPVRLRLSVRGKATSPTEWETVFPTIEHSSPIAVDGQVFLAVGSTLHAFALDGCGAAQCNPTWTRDLGGPTTQLLAAAGSPEVYALAGSEVLAIDRATGALRWRGGLMGTARGAAVDGSTVYVSGTGAVRAFRTGGCGGQQECRPIWTMFLDTPTWSSPVVAAGVLYVGSVEAVTAFAVEGCGGPVSCEVAELPVPGPVTSLSVADGRLLVAHTAGLTAFAPAPP